MNRKFTKKKAPTRSPLIIGLWVAMMAALIGELFFSTWCRVQCTRTGYEITAVTSQNRKLFTLQRNLRIELERLKSPKRIEAKALALGLMVPTPEQTLRLR
ncbi:MAG: hypothetical protein GY697_20860 [Desulfobacterales bacterium]|nr:hypothetical protein [Desulfobacterales bacterium]